MRLGPTLGAHRKALQRKAPQRQQKASQRMPQRMPLGTSRLPWMLRPFDYSFSRLQLLLLLHTPTVQLSSRR